jgi:hypothetical protein
MAAALACNSAALLAADVPAANPARPAEMTSRSGDLVDVRKSVEYLASDELEGRGIGTKGLDKAADYIADTFKKLGLQPAPGASDYFQPFTITAASAPDPKTALTVGGQAYALEKDFGVIGMSAEGQFDGPVVFAGYGVSSKEHGYDDYAGLDVKGKVVLVLRYEPHDDTGVSRFTRQRDEWSPQASLMRKLAVAAEHGAAALLLVSPPAHHEGDDLMTWQSMGGEGPIPFLHVRRHVADQMLKRAGAKDLAALQAEIDGSGKPLAHPLPGVTAAGQVKIIRTDTPVKNVVGVLPGSGELAGEYVVVGSHYDHLGHGGPGSFNPNLREIHNGADDNASGTSAMMEFAERFAARYRDLKPGASARSILFVAFTAEESGLIGSQHFVSNSPVPLDKIAYMLNLDMVGRVSHNSLSIGGTATAPSFEGLLKRADEASPLELSTFSKGGYGPSDHMSFALRKIPVLFFWSGTHADYHRPSDDADKINYEGIEHVIQLGTTVLDAMTTMPREAYVASADDNHAGMAPGSGSGGSRVTLGVVPHYGPPDKRGVKIDGTTPGTPAEAAGLQAGDIIVQFGDEKLTSLQGLTDVLRRSKAGDKVKLVVLRDGKTVELEATLAARK